MALFNKKKAQDYLPKKQEPKPHQILIVDDEQANLGVLSGMLQSRYRLKTAANGLEALNLVTSQAAAGNHFSVIISDQRMPKMTGTEFFSNILDIMPHTKRIILTAYTDIDTVGDAVNHAQIYKFILKPYEQKDVLLTVQRAVEAYETAIELERHRRDLERLVAERTRELEEKNTHLKRTQEQLIMQEKMASMGTLSAGIAHELKNPMNFISNFTQLNSTLLGELAELFDDTDQVTPETFDHDCREIVSDVKENNQRVVNHVKRAVRIINSMMDFVVEPGRQGPHPVVINLLLEEFTELAYHGFLANHTAVDIKIVRDFDESIGAVVVNQLNLSRVITNIMGNALEAVWGKCATADAPYRGEIRITTRNAEDHVTIDFWDNGPGVSEENQKKIFDHFFTTKRTGSNIGLGLSISHDIIVREHGGKLELNSVEGEYTRFRLTLPKPKIPVVSEESPSKDSGSRGQ